MTNSKLADILKSRYEKAPPQDKAAHVVLFGIEYAEALAHRNIAEATALAEIGKWGPQVALGRKPATFVEKKT